MKHFLILSLSALSILAVGKTPDTLSKNYLVLIGINQYKYWRPLVTPLNDVNEIEEVLWSRYNFTPENTYRLINDTATKLNIDNTMRKLIGIVTENDNVLIYFAGHGYYDPSFDEGSWIPVEAERNNTTAYISNSTIYKYIKAFKSKHTLVIADACFSGTFYTQSGRGEETYQEKVASMPSRWVFSSGRQEVVADEMPGTHHSPFAFYLIKSLEENDKNLLVSELINEVCPAVANNSNQTPLGAPIREAGDEGGQFLFILKK